MIVTVSVMMGEILPLEVVLGWVSMESLSEFVEESSLLWEIKNLGDSKEKILVELVGFLGVMTLVGEISLSEILLLFGKAFVLSFSLRRLVAERVDIFEKFGAIVSFLLDFVRIILLTKNSTEVMIKHYKFKS